MQSPTAARLALLGVLLVASCILPGARSDDLAVDDECSAAAPGEEPGHCALSALQRRGIKATAVAGANASEGATCGPLSYPANAGCAAKVRWAAKSGKWDPSAASWYSSMQEISGVGYEEATEGDFQRLFFCAPPGGQGCGTPPCTCSKPPCGTCFGGAPPEVKRPGCAAADLGIACVPPLRAMDYRGQTWPTLTIPGTDEMHIFAIGDWGGMDGSLNPIEDRPKMVAYSWGARSGPSVFPRTRWNKRHTKELCSHKEFIACFNTRGEAPCVPGCGYVKGVDDQPQQLVAQALKARAAENDPQFLLNVGDNFYWGGIEKNCGTPMNELSYTAHHQFNQIFESIYNGPGLSGKPWLSVLGNHDWGGRVFNNGWDQQIAYTWHSPRWIMPAPYWRTTANFVDLGFTVDMFFLDSNHMDAKDPPKDSEHNICGSAHNPPGADCAAADGPTSVATCKSWFQRFWGEQQVWLSTQMMFSRADWQIAVTHFPCGHEQAFYARMRSMGLDLLVTGHRHDQELWRAEDYSKNHMRMTCIVTGGGGGITSEATPNPLDTVDWYGEAEYGFYDLTISKTELLIQSINWNGTIVANYTVYPSR